MPSFTPTNAFLAALDSGAVDLTNIVCGQLMTPGYTFDRRSHNTMAAITGEVSPVSGYFAGGQSIPVTITQNAASHVSTVAFDPVVWTAALSGVRGMIIYARPPGSTPATQLVIGWNDFGADQASVAGKFRVAGAAFTCTKTGSSSITIPDAAVDAILRGQINPDTDTIYAMVLAPSYVRSTAHSRRSDLIGYEVTGAGYVAGGGQVSVTVNRDDAANATLTQFGGVILPPCTISGRYVAYYKRLGGAASADPVLAVVDWGGTYSSSAAVFPIGSNAWARSAVVG